MSLKRICIITPFILSICLAFAFVSCQSDQDDDERESGKTSKQTIIVYMPWSGADLYAEFVKNIKSLESAIKNDHSSLNSKRLMVFISQSDRQSTLFEIKIKSKKCVRDTMQTYGKIALNTEEGISNILNDIKTFAPAPTYAMLIGSHGMGWLPPGTKVPLNTLAKPTTFEQKRQYPKTRFFGHQTEINFQTEVKNLATAIQNENMHMAFIVFDDCYMANIETAYELRDATDYLVASTSEIFLEGIPYKTAGAYLLKADLKNVCQAFYHYYSSYTPPCGALSVTACKETERLAEIMKEINNNFTFDDHQLQNIQVLDGLTVSIFFDLGDYVKHLCGDEKLLATFNAQLHKTVIHEVHTATLHSDHNQKQFPVRTYSGLTISDPSKNPAVTKNVEKTSWYQATH